MQDFSGVVVKRRPKIHWIAWEKLTAIKDRRELGFRDLEAFNTALLGKQIWRIITKPNLLMFKVMKSKYFSQIDFFYARAQPNDSWIWKSWIGANMLLKEGCSWQVGRENKINVWNDKWLKDREWRKVISPKPENCTIQSVRELMNQEGLGWNESLLAELFMEKDVAAIRHTPISLLGNADKMSWPLSKDDQYTARSGYQIAKIYQQKSKRDEGSSHQAKEGGEEVVEKYLGFGYQTDGATFYLEGMP